MFVPPYIFISRTLQFCFWRRAGTFYISAPCKAHSSDLQFLPTCGANAAMLLLCLWVAALKMKVCLNWGFGTCKREFVQACVCTSINEKKNLLRLCLVGSRFEAASVLGLRFWQMQKRSGSSLYLHIHKPKNLPGLTPGKNVWFTDVQTQAWTNYLLHLPQPQSKHALIFKAATQQTKKHNFFLFIWAAVKIGKKCNLIF